MRKMNLALDSYSYNSYFDFNRICATSRLICYLLRPFNMSLRKHLGSNCVRRTPNEIATPIKNHISIKVHFEDWKIALLNYINEADIILACIAWLTDPDILDALAKKKVLIVVQKEDFLRPPTKQAKSYHTSWKAKLQNKYRKLRQLPWHAASTDLVDFLDISSLSDPDGVEDAIRCVGNHNKDKDPAFPRMHNKFLIFCKSKKNNGKKIGEYDRELDTFAVWTGSCNLTFNAGQSFENGVYIHNEEIGQIYLKEFRNIFSISESLDWETDWVSPVFRFGS